MTPVSRRILSFFLYLCGVAALLILSLIAFIALRWDAPVDRPVREMRAPRDSATIARGEYIFRYQAQCWGCHGSSGANSATPPAGGRLFDLRGVGPGFGEWRSRNLTPDAETGLGAWSDGDIIRAFREGLRKDGTVMFPLMPSDWYHGMSDEDALAVVAYLRSLPPVRNAVAPQEPSFMAKALFAFGVLKPQAAINDPVVAPPRGVNAAWGKYVGSHLAGCVECHSPRNLADGSFYMDSLAAGSTIEYGADEDAPLSAFARNLTPDVETGIGSWTESQFLAAVTSGMRPDGTVLTPHMPYASYKACSEEDLRAIYLYLRTLPAIRRTTPPVRASERLGAVSGAERGTLLFDARCAPCHGVQGAGAPPTGVVLAEVAPSLNDAELIDMIRTGQPDLKMPSFGATLTEGDIADIVAHIRQWGQP